MDEALPRHTPTGRKPGRRCGGVDFKALCTRGPLVSFQACGTVSFVCAGSHCDTFGPACWHQQHHSLRRRHRAETWHLHRGSFWKLAGGSHSLGRRLPSVCVPLANTGALPETLAACSERPAKGWSLMSAEEREGAASGVPYEPLPR